jgi:UDP-glucose 4-epimerase
MRFLITGGAGFIGSNLSRYLLKKNHQVTIFDIKRLPANANNAAQSSAGFADCITGDITNKQAWTPLYERKFDCLIHLASSVGVEKVSSSRLETISSIIDGTRNALLFTLSARIPIIYFSTSEVYGNATPPFIEDLSTLMLGQATYPRWCYASAKICAEHMVLGYQKEMGIKAAIIRPFNVTGIGQSSDFVVPKFVQAALKNDQITVKAGQSRCFLSVQDAVRAVEILASKITSTEIGNGEIFNMGNPANRITIIELATKIKQVCSSKSIITEEPNNNIDDIVIRIPDISKISSLLDWHPSIGINQIIESVANSLSVLA